MDVRIIAARALVLLLLFPLLWGCGSGPSADDRESFASEGRRLFGGTGSATDSDTVREGAQGTEGGGWGIVLRSMAGDPPRERVERLLKSTRQAVGRSDVRLVRRSSGVAVVMGSYERPDSDRAQRDVSMVREITVGGRRPFASAFLAPPMRRVDFGDHPQYNLSTAKSRFGSEAIWTLQIAVYESEDRREAKEAAEEAVVKLRREGEQAFYYHGRTQSMVTIGVFGRNDYDEQRGPKNPALYELIERYPRNLLNGQYPIIVKRAGQPEREQRSLLVRIPEP